MNGQENNLLQNLLERESWTCMINNNKKIDMDWTSKFLGGTIAGS